MNELTAFVLAGGQSTRMGTEKALLEWQGSTLLERALRTARSAASVARVVGPKTGLAAYDDVVEDIYRDRGPLGGIHAALAASITELNLILAVDMPFLEARFLNFLISRAQEGTPTVTVPKTGGGWQPLCAIYRRSFAQVAESALREGRNKVDALFSQVPLCVIEEAELRRLGFDPLMFENLNTRAQFEQARLRSSGKGRE